MDVLALIRQLKADPDIIETWDDATRDVVLAKMGVDVKLMRDRFDNAPRDEDMDRIIQVLLDRPELIPTMPLALMNTLLDYIGGNSDPEIAKQAFREAGIAID